MVKRIVKKAVKKAAKNVKKKQMEFTRFSELSNALDELKEVMKRVRALPPDQQRVIHAQAADAISKKKVGTRKNIQKELHKRYSVVKGKKTKKKPSKYINPSTRRK